MTVLMILTPPGDDDRMRDRTGDAFDTAFVEILRTLDGQGSKVPVLVPWSSDLAPLVTAALIDTAPSFDPEGGGSAAATRSRIIPYSLTAEDAGLMEGASDREIAFWRSSHLSLARGAPVHLGAAMGAAPPTHFVVLGLPKAAAEVAAALKGRPASVFCFGSLVSRGEVVETLGVSFGDVEDLERRLLPEKVPSEDYSSPEREREESLEPYVPYGLLLQDALDEFLPGDERAGGKAT